MTASERALVKKLRHRIDRERKFSPRLRGYWDRHGHVINRLIALVFLSLLFASLVAIASKEPSNLMIFAYLLSIVTFLFGTGCDWNAYFGPWTEGLVFLPVSDDDIFRRIWRIRRHQSLGWLWCFLGVYSLAAISMAKFHVGPVPWGAAIVAAIANWMLLRSIVAIWTAFFPMFDGHYALRATCLLGGLLVFYRPLQLDTWIADSVPWILLLMPTGWVAGGFLAWTAPNGIPFWIYAACTVGVISLLPTAFRKMQRDYRILEVAFHGAFGFEIIGNGSLLTAGTNAFEVATDQSFEIEAESCSVDALHSDRTTPEEFSSDELREHLTPIGAWQSEGFLERLILRPLSTRRRIITELISGGRWEIRQGEIHRREKSWGETYVNGLQWTLIGYILVFAFPIPNRWEWIAYIPIIFGTMKGVSIFGGRWRGIHPLGALAIANLPVGYHEIARIYFYVVFSRLALWMPIFLSGMALSGARIGFALDYAFLLGLKTALIMFAFQGPIFHLRMNNTMDDESGSFLRTAKLVLVAVLSTVAITTVIALYIDEWQLNLFAAICLLAMVVTVHLYDRWRHERGKRDFINWVQPTERTLYS